ncbi:hypothetical protein SAMN05421847_2924 [Halpernia humi]|uniref:Uncharacterized protein n=1 Tax=Halpernia humi TaxID=493375 RepID=A0A1H6BJ06_9FLAO|nr:hypothetical protein [Halpernia humi]SEG60690.1 hypothetical protein SAMN05421847_2924 [Halpernia humi]
MFTLSLLIFCGIALIMAIAREIFKKKQTFTALHLDLTNEKLKLDSNSKELEIYQIENEQLLMRLACLKTIYKQEIDHPILLEYWLNAENLNESIYKISKTNI